MRGFPKYLCTKVDYEYVWNHFPPEQRERDFFGALLDDQKKYFLIRVLSETESIILTIDQKIIDEIDETGKKVRYLMELQIDQNCKMCKLGITLKDIQKWG